ncbi:hypothetical protein [uncultured Desulfobacter sp.]|uniref:hypothetical protein n=1 Tax=uncultured Desulfobacter sp. TaxID=240139 RepID=UPI0029F577E9|nr:hypothetical protein [uncultured Desulfobacter sp.]
MEKYFGREAESESVSFKTKVDINVQYASLYKALDEMFGLNDDDDPDHPLSSIPEKRKNKC